MTDQPNQKIRPDRLREIADGAMGIGAPLVLTQAEQVAVCTELLACREQNARLVADMMALGQERSDACAERDAARAEAEKLRAELEAARDEVTQLEGMERQRDACCDDYQKEAARAVALEAELAAVRRQRERFAQFVIRSFEACGAYDWACAQCKPSSDMLVDGFVCAYHEAKALAAEQPKPIEPRPWWVVFGLERWEATKLHALHPSEIERRLGGMADIAGKRQIHPTEIARALDEARAELQPKPEVQP